VRLLLDTQIWRWNPISGTVAAMALTVPAHTSLSPPLGELRAYFSAAAYFTIFGCGAD
jgi:hypothetical protein